MREAEAGRETRGRLAVAHGIKRSRQQQMHERFRSEELYRSTRDISHAAWRLCLVLLSDKDWLLEAFEAKALKAQRSMRRRGLAARRGAVEKPRLRCAAWHPAPDRRLAAVAGAPSPRPRAAAAGPSRGRPGHGARLPGGRRVAGAGGAGGLRGATAHGGLDDLHTEPLLHHDVLLCQPAVARVPVAVECSEREVGDERGALESKGHACHVLRPGDARASSRHSSMRS